jgi:hypothetical protein
MPRQHLARIQYSDVYNYSEAPSAFFYEAGMTIDADGAYRAYHRNNALGLDYLANAGHPGNWWGVVTDTGEKDGQPVVQRSTDPAPGFYVSATTLGDASKGRTDPRRYVDSESVPFLVLPGNQRFGARVGDFGMVFNPRLNRACGCVFADHGPRNKIGEGSIALARALGVPHSPKNGGVGNGIVYWVAGGSKTSWPLSVADIKSTAQTLFDAWGGLVRLKRGLPQITWP